MGEGGSSSSSSQLVDPDEETGRAGGSDGDAFVSSSTTKQEKTKKKRRPHANELRLHICIRLNGRQSGVEKNKPKLTDGRVAAEDLVDGVDPRFLDDLLLDAVDGAVHGGG